jgi:sugar phosphate isomerase/epimerase
MKDAARQLNGRHGILASHLPFGDGRRGWDFRNVGRGDVRWEDIMRAVNRIGYSGPLSGEWEDARLDRDVAAPGIAGLRAQACRGPSERQFDAALSAIA